MQRHKRIRHCICCQDCPFWAPPTRCFNPALKSGRCGDWIWFVRAGKQLRRPYACPKDPRTVSQLLRRRRFAAASRRYSRLLTEEQREACIAAGAKLQSRPRLGQSGPLTGQQYWVHKDAAPAKPAVKRKDAEFTSEPPQSQRLTRTSSDPHRTVTGPLPERPRSGRRVARGIKQPPHALHHARNRRLTGIGGRQYRRIARLTRPRARHRAGTLRVSRRPSVSARPDFRRAAIGYVTPCNPSPRAKARS